VAAAKAALRFEISAGVLYGDLRTSEGDPRKAEIGDPKPEECRQLKRRKNLDF
jgi:hypothetical protein